MSPTIGGEASPSAALNCTGQPQPDHGAASPGGDWCPVYWDTLSCWPSTPPGQMAIHPCPGEYAGVKYDASQNATRQCLANGTWDTRWNFSQCLWQFEDDLHSVRVADIYYVGYSLSLVSLIFAVAIYLYYRELKCLRNVIHTNLMFTYILLDLVWILTMTSHIMLEPNIPICIISYTLLIYFTLTNFFWMFVEGLYLYLLVVRTFSSDIKLRMCLFIGWGIPMFVVVIWAVAKAIGGYDLVTTSKSGEEALMQHCPWMVPHPFDCIYIGPSLVVLIINVGFLFTIMWVLITKLRAANNVETQQYRKAAKALLVLIPLLGITYIIVLYGPQSGQSEIIFDYARAVLLSTQGVTVAVLYCFLNSEVRNALRHHYDRWRAARLMPMVGRRGKRGRRHHHGAGACNGGGGGGPGGATATGAGGRCTRSSCSYSAWAPRSRTESIRLCQRGGPPERRTGPGPARLLVPASALAVPAAAAGEDQQLPLDGDDDGPVEQLEQPEQQQLRHEPDRYRAARAADAEIDDEQRPLRPDAQQEILTGAKLPNRFGFGAHAHRHQLVQNGTGPARTHRPRHL